MAIQLGMNIHPGQLLPPFVLPSTVGLFKAGAFRGKRPLVVLVGAPSNGHEFECAAAGLALRHDEFERAGAVVVAVTPADEATARALAERQRLPFPVAWDERGDTVDRLADSLEGGTPGVALYVTDRFLSIHLCVVARTAADLPSPDRLVALVEGIERECPECGVADEGW